MSYDILSTLREKEPTFSKGQKRIARYITEDYDKAAFMTASRLGVTVGVSESTVVRFATELGYDGYPHLQRALQEMIRNKLTSVQRMEVAGDRMGGRDVLQTVLHADTDMIRVTLDEIDRDAFQGAVDALTGAHRIYILGVRSSSALANFLGLYFNLLFDNVTLVHTNSVSEIFEQVLRIVNTDNDLPRFTAAVDADPDDGDLILVNKYSRLASDYVPEDLVTVEPAYSNGGKLKSEANDAFCDLVEAMWAETGLHLVNASPYRSYQTQKNLYARYRTQYSEATTDRFSARAGYSEHQTGLALDVIAPGGTLNGFKNTQQFVWMRDNAHRFGFILRYGDGMEYITGYKFEPWHYRYVGVDAATFIYENDLTFEEYYAYYVKK